MAHSRPPWWIVALGLAFLGQHFLLFYCDARRPEPDGILFGFSGGRVVVDRVEPASAGARSGLTHGDVLVACDGQVVTSRVDWGGKMANVEVGRPVVLTVERAGVQRQVQLVFQWDAWREDNLRQALTRLGVRAIQSVVLLLALVGVFKRPDDAVARVCAWALATFAVFNVVPQYRLYAVWRGLGWFGAPLWLPFLSADAVGAVVFTFFAVFPRVRVRSAAVWALLWAPILVVLAPHAYYTLDAVYRPDRFTAVPDWFIPLIVVNLGYIVAAVSVLIVNYRRLDDVNERRRVRVLAFGSIAGCTVGGAFVLIVWLASTNLALYESPVVSLGALLLLAMPVSFAYAILRHRIFDVSVIIRQGLQYGVARGVLLSVVPLVVAGLATDVLIHRSQPVEDVLAFRGWIYVALAAVAIAAHLQRRRWLDALDRRFFRERYDAQRLLRLVVEEVRAAGSLSRVAARVVARVEAALHPTFVALLEPDPGEGRFRVMASVPAGAAPENLPSTGKWAALLGVLGRPLDVPVNGTDGLAAQLPAEDLGLLRRARIEMLAPVTGESHRLDALLVLGSKRSEEPYSKEDRDLLATIAGGLALLAERRGSSPAAVETLAECPRCGACFDRTVTACPADGSAPRPSRLPHVLAGRYRLDHRLGRGGMGTVYRALDTALDRQVAVKLIREDLAGREDMAARFQQEARAAAAFAHPNVVTVHDFGIEGGAHAYLVMELLEGATLRAGLQRERTLQPGRIVSIMRGVSAAVDAAHRRDLVHRDLKPENVFLVGAGEAETTKILDFGIAKALRAPNGATTVADTGAGWLVGTPQYMAPEQLRGGDAGPAWDLWAMAVMTYEMLVGRLPFSGLQVDTEPGGLPGGYLTMMLAPLAGAPAQWKAFFARALSHDQASRPDSARALFAELERALQVED